MYRYSKDVELAAERSIKTKFTIITSTAGPKIEGGGVVYI